MLLLWLYACFISFLDYIEFDWKIIVSDYLETVHKELVMVFTTAILVLFGSGEENHRSLQFHYFQPNT